MTAGSIPSDITPRVPVFVSVSVPGDHFVMVGRPDIDAIFVGPDMMQDDPSKPAPKVVRVPIQMPSAGMAGPIRW